jgi:hypothetical protein
MIAPFLEIDRDGAHIKICRAACARYCWDTVDELVWISVEHVEEAITATDINPSPLGIDEHVVSVPAGLHLCKGSAARCGERDQAGWITEYSKDMARVSIEREGKVSPLHMKIVSLRPTGSPYHDVVEHHSIGRVAQLLKDFRSSKSPGHASQRGELGSLVSF